MRYKRFAIENFKGIKQLSLDLNEGATTLIGLNESGKTTILEAIFAFPFGAEAVEAINPDLASFRNPEGWIPVSERANFNGIIKITATVALDESDQRELTEFAYEAYELKLHSLPSQFEIAAVYDIKNSRHDRTKGLWGLRFKGTQGKQRKPRIFGSNTPEWHGLIKYLKDKLPTIWYFPDFLFEFPERFVLWAPSKPRVSLPFPEVAEESASPADAREIDRNRIYRTTFENIVERLGYGATLDTHIVSRLRSHSRTDRRSLDAVLLHMSRLVTETVFDGWNRIFGRAPAAQEVQIDADFGANGAAYLELKIKGPDGYYDLSERSLGFRWFFMFLLMTSFQKTDSKTKPLILLDEPASNLHSSAQAELLKSFAKLIETADLIYTTHSHHLIDVRWLDSAYVIKNKALDSIKFTDYLSARLGTRTSITATRYRKFVIDNPGQTSYIQPVLDLLNYQPSTLEPVPDVTLVEGKSDFFAMRYVAEVINDDTSLKLVPGGGASSFDALIRLHIGWGKSFLVLLDGDAEGKRQRQRYEREFGHLILNRCVTLPELCDDEGALEIEDLFEASDKLKIVSRVYPDIGTPRRISKKNLQHAIMELYARREPVDISKPTIERFSRLFEQLSERLRASV